MVEDTKRSFDLKGIEDMVGKLIKLGSSPTVYKVAKDGSLRRTDFGKRPNKAQVKMAKRARRRGKCAATSVGSE